MKLPGILRTWREREPESLGAVAVDLKLALHLPGCPICHVRGQDEERYVRGLLREGLSHVAAWTHVVNALGYCQRHTWEIGRLEVQYHGSALSTSGVYADLVRVVCGRLAGYANRAAAVPHSGWRRVLDRLLRRHRGLPLPYELQPQESCRVCQIGEQAEKANASWLLQELSAPQPLFRELYGHPGRLCLGHLRLALRLVVMETSPAATFLVRDALEYLSSLSVELDEYGGKHAWVRRFDKMSPAEESSWLRALAFFGGNERERGNDEWLSSQASQFTLE